MSYIYQASYVACCLLVFAEPHSQASPARECVYMGRAWYLLSREHDVIEIGPEFSEQKGNVLRIVQPTMRPTLGVYDIHPLIYS